MMKSFTYSLALMFLVFLGCNRESPLATNPVQDQSTINLDENTMGSGSDPYGHVQMGDCPNIYYVSSKVLSNGDTVTWTSSFGGFDYSQGSFDTLSVGWSVNPGTATFVRFIGKRKTWTPKGIGGSWSTFNQTSGSIDLTVKMDPMHRAIDPVWHGYIGNAHFKLELTVDSIKVKLGVNVHFEDPDDGYDHRCMSNSAE